MFLQLTKWRKCVFFHALCSHNHLGLDIVFLLVLCRDMRRCMCLH